MTDSKTETSIFSKSIHPVYQLGVTIVLIILAMGITYLTTDEPVVFWEIALSSIMGFALFNTIFSLSCKDRLKYFRDSIFSFMAIAAIGGFLAYKFSGLTIDEAGSFRWLYLVFTFSYLVFISIVNAMRKIIDIAKKQDARLRGEE